MPILSAKVDAATYDAFNDVCARQGTNMNRLITRLAEIIIADPGVIDHWLLGGDRHGPPALDSETIAQLNEIKISAQAAAVLTVNMLRAAQPTRYLDMLKQCDPQTRQFVKKLIADNGPGRHRKTAAAEPVDSGEER